MTFPASPLGVRVELDLNGTWTDISGDVDLNNGAAVTIGRGRPDGTQQASPTSANMQWANQNGQYSPRNPLGPYYGQLQRNTPIRISIPSATPYLRLRDNSASISTPSSAGLQITGDIDIQIDMNLISYVPAVLFSKWTSGGQRDWAVLLNSDGTIGFMWYDGTTQHLATSSAPVPLGRSALAITLTVASPYLVNFYTAPNINGTFTIFSNSVVGPGATSIAGSTAPVIIGSNPNFSESFNGGSGAGPVGAIYATKVESGIGVLGTVKAFPDFTSQTPGASSFADAQGNTWTLAGNSEISGRNYRAHVEASALPQTWSREEVWTPVQASGQLRRLQQTSASLDSPMKRAYVRLTGALAPIAYWPCEDISGSTQIASGIGGQPMAIGGPISFAADSSFVSSLPLPTIANTMVNAVVPPYTSGTDAIMRFLLHIPTGGMGNQSVIARYFTTGTIARYDAYYGTGGGIGLRGFNQSGTQLFDTGAIAFHADNQRFRVSMELRKSGSNVNYSIAVVTPGSTSGLGFAGTVTSATVGNVTRLEFNPGQDTTAFAIGHVSVQSTWETLFDLGPALGGWSGETAGSRFVRLCAEQGLNGVLYGFPASSVPMGAQSIDTFMNLLQECEDADGGMIYEPRDTLGIGYRTSRALCSQTPAVSLDYSQDQISPPLTPTDDDQYTQNDVVVSRVNGSSFTATLNDGSPMSISNPPVGAGDYQFSWNLNLFTDTQLGDAANWRLNIGTVNEERYPSIMVDLAASSTNITSIFQQVLDVDMGDYVAADNLPYFLPPDGIQALVWGSSEVLGDYVCNVAWQTQPESPYEVLVAGSIAVANRQADTDGSTGAAIGTGDTNFIVQTVAGSNFPLWTTSPSDLPFDVIRGGERMTVTNIDGPPGNFLSGDTATFDGSLGTWTPAGNCALPHVTTPTHSGPGAASMVCNNAANMSAAHCTAANILTQGIACSPNDVIAAAIWILAASTPRSTEVGVQFYTSAGVSISTLNGTALTDATSGWTKLTASVVAPATAAFCRLLVTVIAPALTEVHYIDDAYLADVTTGNQFRQTFTVTRSVNGVVKSHPGAEPIHLFSPVVFALA